MIKRFILLLGLAALAALFPAVALAAVDAPPASGPQLLTEQQFWAAVIGLFTPLIGYVLNRLGPQVSQPVKLAVQIATAAAVGALYQLLDAGDLHLNTETLQIVGTTVISALLVGHPIFKLGNVNVRLGGYLRGEPVDSPAAAAKLDGV